MTDHRREHPGRERLAILATVLAVGALAAGPALPKAAGPPPSGAAPPANATIPAPAPEPPPSPAPAPKPPPTPSATPGSGGMVTVTCRFSSGLAAGQQASVTMPPPAAVGETCHDGAGSVGVVAPSAPAAASGAIAPSR
jgi:hypothetical protein